MSAPARKGRCLPSVLVFLARRAVRVLPVLCLFLLPPLVTACSVSGLFVPSVEYQPPQGETHGKGKAIVLATADFRQTSRMSSSNYGIVPIFNRLYMQVSGGDSGLFKPHEALHEALKARLAAQGYTVLAPGDPGAAGVKGIIACLHVFHVDNTIPSVSRADVSFSLVEDGSLGSAPVDGLAGYLARAKTIDPCAASLGMVTASQAGTGKNMEAAFSDALAFAVNGVELQACLR